MFTLTKKAKQFDILFIGGKGGVGKTTVAAALAAQISQEKRRTLIISTDPAHSLGDVLQVQLSDEIYPISSYLSALELDPDVIIQAHFQKVEEAMLVYAKPEMMSTLRQHLALAKHSPGAEEAALLEAICHYLVAFKTMGFEQLIFDTAPTGHTLRLLILPEMMRAWTDGLLARTEQQKNIRSAMRMLDDSMGDATHNNFSTEDSRLAQVANILSSRSQLFEEARAILHNNKKSAIFLVLTPEMLPLIETQRTYRQLQECHLPLSGIVINQVMEEKQQDLFWQQRAMCQSQIIEKIEKNLADIDRFYIPLKAEDIRGIAALQNLGNS